MNPDELPLLDLFNRLRECGLPLGIEEYMAVLRALQAGFGVGDRRTLEQLCCAVWVNSEEEARLFRRLFERMLTQRAARVGDGALLELPQPPLTTPTTLLPPEMPVRLVSEIVDRWPPDEPLEQLSEASTKPSHGAATAPPLETPGAPLPESPSPPSSAAYYPGLTLEVDEPVQVVQAVRYSMRDDSEMNRPRFGLLTEYLPVTRRQMKQSWRHLRRPTREGPPEELDVKATIEKVGREGVLLEPVLVPRRSNRAKLVLLVDWDGSMVPFHPLSRRLVETARRGGRLGQAGVYYFHDYPDGYLYGDPPRLKAQPIPDVMETVGEWAMVLIVSDAGAARGHLDPERVERTRSFVQQLKQVVRRYAWLNPMPNNRWPDTTAGEIARFVPMFEMSRCGLDAAISALQGRYVYWEKVYPWMM